MLGRNAVRPGENAQPRGGSYEGREGQIMWRRGEMNGGYRGGGNIVSREGNQLGP